VEVIKKVKEDKLKEYPLSAKDLIAEIKKREPSIKQNRIYDIIKENEIKDNRDYSDFSFRNQNHRLDYEKNKNIVSGTPSIFKPITVDFILSIYKNEKLE
jgi:hypothetical protein